MNLNELLNARDTAGERYAAALVELQRTYIELAGYDMAVANGNVPVQSPRTFTEPLNEVPLPMLHPNYAPDRGSEWRAEIKARGEELIAEFSKG